MKVFLSRDYLIAYLIAFMAISLTACSGGSEDTSPVTLQESLNLLGVSTDVTQRTDENGEVIADSYQPLGDRINLIKVDNGDGTSRLIEGSLQELFIVGMRTSNCLNANCFAALIDDVKSTSDFTFAPSVLYQHEDSIGWSREDIPVNSAPETLRDATGADVDGDGRSEPVMVYFDQLNNEVHLSVADTDASGSPATDMIVPLTQAQFPVTDLRIVSGNFDSDTEEEIVIGVSHHSVAPFEDSGATLFIVDGKSNDYATLKTIEVSARDASRSLSLVLETAQLDYDGEMELIVIQNEQGASGIQIIDPVKGSLGILDAEAYFTVFDDIATQATVINAGFIEANVERPVGGDVYPMRARIADVSTGDIDNDSIDEIFFAGIVDPLSSSSCGNIGHVLVSIDDAAHQFSGLSESYSNVRPRGNCPEFDGWNLRFAHINLLDIDGDDDLEIQVNQYIFDAAPVGNTDWAADAIYTPVNPDASYWPVRNLIFRDDEPRALFDRTNSLMTVADVTGDGKDNLITYLQGNNEIIIYGHDAETDTVIEIAATRIIGNGILSRINPVIVAMNSDSDTSIYAPMGNHEFVISEPLVLGVLAAPPCIIGINQNLDACTTTWGQSSTIGVGREKGFEVSAGATIGITGDTQSCGGVVYSQCTTIFEYEAKATLELALSRSRANSYELTKSVAFTTGPLEDSVVFVALPMDLYDYRLLLEADDIDAGGVLLTVSLPREPITSMTEIAYFNQSVDDDKKISNSLFQHIPGEIDSYPTATDKDYILAEKRSQLEDVRIDRFLAFNPVFDDDAPLDALEGLDVGSIGVGQGGGSTEIGLDLAKDSSLNVSNEVRFSFEFTASGGVLNRFLAGFSVGASGFRTLTVSKGSATSYIGSVGSIEGNSYAANQYQFGLFTYLQADPRTGREFEVINYWVQ